MPHGGAQAVRISSRVRRGKGAGKTNLEGAQRRMTEFTRRIYEVVKQIPKGRVASYGQVAQLAGNPRGARGVGFALHRNPSRASSPATAWCFRTAAPAPAMPSAGPKCSAACWRTRASAFCRTAAWIWPHAAGCEPPRPLLSGRKRRLP